MNLWNKLRGKNKCEGKFERVESDVRLRMEPLETLVLSIVAAADKCSRTVTGRPPAGAVASAADIFVLNEFMYFFLHLTMREAFELQFEPARLEKLGAYLAPLMAAAAVDSFCSRWPEDRKSKLRSDFCDDLNDADIAYAKCEPVLVSRDEPLTGNTLLAKLVGRVVEAREGAARLQPLERTLALQNPEMMMVALSAAVDAIGELRLNERVAGAGGALDQITIEEIRHAVNAASR